MKIGSETGSVVNHVMAGSAPSTPTVGMGATILMWTDRHACTIVEVAKNGKKVVVQEDAATRVDKNGMSESQEYAYAPEPRAPRRTFSLRKNGRWVEVSGSTGLAIGFRQSYHDFSF